MVMMRMLLIVFPFKTYNETVLSTYTFLSTGYPRTFNVTNDLGPTMIALPLTVKAAAVVMVLVAL